MEHLAHFTSILHFLLLKLNSTGNFAIQIKPFLLFKQTSITWNIAKIKKLSVILNENGEIEGQQLPGNWKMQEEFFFRKFLMNCLWAL